jgi:signal transduction histidine kinase
MNKFLRSILIKNNLVDSGGNITSEDCDDFLNCISLALDEREKEFESLKSEKEKLKVILDTTPCTISWLKKDMTYGGVNKALADLTNLKTDSFDGKTIGFYTDNKYFYNFADTMFQSKSPSIYQELKTEIDGDEKQFWVTGSKFDNGNQGVVIGIDITELNNMREHVSFNDKLSQLGEMVASIIHEVNNPLTLIRMQGQRLESLVNKGEMEKIVAASKKIVETSDKISQIIRGVKSYVRGGEQDPKQIVSLNEVIADAIVICEGKLKEQQVSIEIKESLEVKININVTQIFQVIVNLITNGADAIEGLDEKWLKVDWVVLEDHIRINFTDSGEGIPESVQKGMWDSFFTTKGIGKGTGLGLSLCAKIIGDHEGRIYVDNTCSNTRFSIELPLGS